MGDGAKEWVLKPIYSQTLITLLRDIVANSTRRDALDSPQPDA